ncbi:MAG: PEP-CTERM sorting domain-containing protein [Acidobacteria bacterium]|nr:PEP-CTERM sorting domain-containing protein [Acidobacteriota bacterium]
MKFLLATVGTALLSVAAFGAPIALTDDFSTPSNAAQANTTGNVGVNTTQNATPIAGVSRTVFVKKTGIPASDPFLNMNSSVGLGNFLISTDTGVDGIGGVFYSVPTTDLTGIGESFSVDWVRSDIPGGTLTFFVTSIGAPTAGNIGSMLNSGTATSTKTFVTAGTAPQTFAALLSTFSGSADLSQITGFGFYWQTPFEQDARFDNFHVSAPEPGTYALMGAGLAALAFLRRRK